MTEHAPSLERIQALIAEQAAQWLVRLEPSGGTPDERIELAAWLRASPAHVLEFLKVRTVWEAMGGTALDFLPDAETLLRQLASENASNVTPLNRTAADASSVDRDEIVSAGAVTVRSRGWLMPAMLAAAALGVVAVGVMVWTPRWFDRTHASYQTAVGAQSIHRLPDGSTVVLNTRSSVRLEYSSSYRDVYLDRGEALFDVAQDPVRPFRVRFGNTMVRALGTRFNVYAHDGGVTVTVLQGRVEATAGLDPLDLGLSGPGTSNAGMVKVQLGAGERARLQTHTPIQPERVAHPERALDWQERRLVFENTPLAEVIAEFNRYNEMPLRLEDPALSGKRINGIFDATDRASLMRFLQEFEDVQIEARPDAVWVRKKR